MTTPPSPRRVHPTPADQMRFRLARKRVRELRKTDLARTHPAAVILSLKGLANVTEDLMEMLLEAWADENTWSDE